MLILSLWYDDEAWRTQIPWKRGYIHPECVRELNSDRMHTNTSSLHLHLGHLADGFVQSDLK